MHEVGFAQTGISIQEERVISISRFGRHCGGSGMRELIAGADNKIFEGVPRVQVNLGLARRTAIARPVHASGGGSWRCRKT